MAELEQLMTAAQTHCQSLDGATRRRSAVLNEVETGLARCQYGLDRQQEALQEAVNKSRAECRRQQDEGAQRHHRLVEFLQNADSQLQSLEESLQSDAEGLTGALERLGEEASQALPPLAEAAQQLHSKVEAVEGELAQVTQLLEREMESLEGQVQSLSQALEDQRDALEKELTERLTRVEEFFQSASRAQAGLAERMGTAGSALVSRRSQSQGQLQEASQSLQSAIREGYRSLAQQISGDARRIQESVDQVHEVCHQGGRQVLDRGSEVGATLGNLCQALEPLAKLRSEASRTGAL